MVYQKPPRNYKKSRNYTILSVFYLTTKKQTGRFQSLMLDVVAASSRLSRMHCHICSALTGACYWLMASPQRSLLSRRGLLKISSSGRICRSTLIFRNIDNLFKKFRMRPNSHKFYNISVKPYKQIISFNMAFHTTPILSYQLMCPIHLWQFLLMSKHVKHFTQSFYLFWVVPILL